MANKDEEIDEIYKTKIQMKTSLGYNSIDNKIENYHLDERKRRKILENLGFDYRKRVKLPEDIDDEEEKHKDKKSKNQQSDDEEIDESAEKTVEALQKIEEEKKQQKLQSLIPEKFRKKAITYENPNNQVAKVDDKLTKDLGTSASAMSLVSALNANTGTVALRKQRVVKPEWHAPWKLLRVISGHQGWVTSIAVDVKNRWFATGSRDRTIKFWDLVEGTLQLTLTGHISTVRGL